MSWLEDAEHGQLMRFVTCKSAGGPHDDESYVAGWECGQVDNVLSTYPTGYARSCHKINERQLDLIAMRHSFEMTVRASALGNAWIDVEFRRIAVTE